jgi:hypothetical protein
VDRLSTWQKFYYAWGGFAAGLGIVILVVLVLPRAILFAAGVLVPLLVLLAVYGVFFVRCPKCGVRLAETAFAHGLPQQHCPLCLYDLKAPDGQAGRR